MCEICHVCMCLCFDYFNDDSYRNWKILCGIIQCGIRYHYATQGMGTNVVKGCNIDNFIHRTNCSFPNNRR